MALAKRLKPGLAVGSVDRLIFAGMTGITPICYRRKWSNMTGMLRRPDLRVHDIRRGSTSAHGLNVQLGRMMVKFSAGNQGREKAIEPLHVDGLGHEDGAFG